VIADRLKQNAPIPNFRSLTNQRSKRPRFWNSKAGNAGDAIQWHLLLIMTVSDYSQYLQLIDSNLLLNQGPRSLAATTLRTMSRRIWKVWPKKATNRK